MTDTNRTAVAAALATQRVLPLFTCTDPVIGVRVLEALHAGGMRLVEFTNRSAAARDVFAALVAAARTRFPDLVLGAGTIIDRDQAASFHEAGAAFVVAPHTDEEVGAYCRERDLLWCPGAGTVTEMVRAHRLGAAVIKVFPADTLGGPAFVKAVRGPCPWLSLMPTGGVKIDAANLTDWFAAGVHCVGMGSNLVDAAAVAAGRFDDITARTRTLVEILSRIPRPA